MCVGRGLPGMPMGLIPSGPIPWKSILLFLGGAITLGALIVILRRGAGGAELVLMQIVDNAGKVWRHVKISVPHYFRIPNSLGSAYVARLDLGRRMALDKLDYATARRYKLAMDQFMNARGPWSARSAPTTHPATWRQMMRILDKADVGPIRLSPQTETLLASISMIPVSLMSVPAVRGLLHLINFLRPGSVTIPPEPEVSEEEP